ncbi:hypothetical protein DPMN_134831 [Dreissena polymorpha]|uniref:Uncharacterized protein n=1 Tax=Dreissena polymorpha TaxID=45954 RepID=A0A9D4JC92_DREPO|nr:hypothetical protein DPMN_134831 [Dreissena polymorpha]
MAQNAQASPVTNLNGQSQASQSSQSSQIYGSPQLTQTPNFYGHGFIPPASPPPLPSSDILSSILERLNSVDKKTIATGPNTTVSGIVSRIDKIDQKMNNFETRIKELEKSCDFSGNMIENLTQKNRVNSTQLLNPRAVCKIERIQRS